MERAPWIDLTNQGDDAGIGNDVGIDIERPQFFDIVPQFRKILRREIGVESQIKLFPPPASEPPGLFQLRQGKIARHGPQTEPLPADVDRISTEMESCCQLFRISGGSQQFREGYFFRYHF